MNFIYVMFIVNVFESLHGAKGGRSSAALLTALAEEDISSSLSSFREFTREPS
jgi:hypothetical protein